MVYSAAYCNIEYKETIKKIFKVDDSKKITEEKREEIFKNMINKPDIIKYQIDIIDPLILSNKMLRRNKYNLNFISHDSAIDLIKKIISIENGNIIVDGI
jgi:ribonuclease H2 subunit A